jgi:transcriptional regulator with XRE-family HTH domain
VVDDRGVDREALGEFLRRRRELLTPAEVGLSPLGHRRTPGLRREEVAVRAYISTDHYTRLEQARGSMPSRPVLHSIARALLLDDAEREHLFALADGLEPTPGSPRTDVPSHVRELIERMPLTAAVIRDAHADVLAWNRLAQVLLSGLFGPAPREHNLLRRYFLHPDTNVRYLSQTDEGEFVQQSVAALRSTLTRHPHDERAQQLVADLRAGSAGFRRLWMQPTRPGGRSGQKLLHHPTAGALELNYDVLDIPDHDHQIVLLTASPGSNAEQALRRLATAPAPDPAPSRQKTA